MRADHDRRQLMTVRKDTSMAADDGIELVHICLALWAVKVEVDISVERFARWP